MPLSSPASASGPMHSESQDGPTTAPSGPDHALASLSAAQASEKGLLTSGTYGHTGSTSSRSAALATSLESRLRAKDGRAWFDTVQADMEALGFAVGAADLCAAGIGAPHIRQRLWFYGTVADASDDRPQGRLPGWQDTQRQMVNGSAGRDSATERMGDTIGVGRQQQSKGRGIDGAGVGSTGREQKQSGKASGSTQRMVDSNDTGRSEGCERPETVGQGRAALAANGTQRMADAEAATDRAAATSDNEARRERDETATLAGLCTDNTAYPTNGYWRDADWLGCRDGKFRPVEPGTFPLVNGAAARVGRLRGYGNAIVAQVAQTFIEATQGG